MSDSTANRISLAAIAGEVLFVGNGEPLFGLTPEVGDEVLRHLPRFLALSRILANQDIPIGTMTDYLRSAGLRWTVVDSDEHTGQWLQGGDDLCPVGEYAEMTRRVFYELFSTAEPNS